jgi:hypothetical protein
MEGRGRVNGEPQKIDHHICFAIHVRLEWNISSSNALGIPYSQVRPSGRMGFNPRPSNL